MAADKSRSPLEKEIRRFASGRQNEVIEAAEEGNELMGHARRLDMIAIAFGLGTLSCGSGEDVKAVCEAPVSASQPLELCDGSQNRRLSVVVTVRSDRVPPYLTLKFENGARFFHVRGDCQYWVSRGYGRYRTGLLDDLQTQLKRDIYYGQWEQRCLARSWATPGLSDVSPLVYSDGNSRVAIAIDADGQNPGVPAEVVRMSKVEYEWIERLWAAGKPVDGPIRLVVIDDPSLTAGVQSTQWPLSWSLAGVAVSKDQASMLRPGEANVVITDPGEIAAIVAIWETYLSEPRSTLEQFPFEEAGKVYAVVIRDTTPLDDATGVIPPL